MSAYNSGSYFFGNSAEQWTNAWAGGPVNHIAVPLPAPVVPFAQVAQFAAPQALAPLVGAGGMANTEPRKTGRELGLPKVFSAVYDGDVAALKVLIDDHLSGRCVQDLNAAVPQEDLRNSADTPFRYALSTVNGEILRELIRAPDVRFDFTRRGDEGRPVFPVYLDVPSWRLLLKDRRCAPAIAACERHNFLHDAICWGQENVVRLLLAYVPNMERCLNQSNAQGRDFSGKPRQVALFHSKGAIIKLLDRLEQAPQLTAFRLRVEDGDTVSLAAEMFAVIVLVCDDYLTFRDLAARSAALEDRLARWRRFLLTASALPMEVQMLLCRRAYGDGGSNLLSKDSELGFKNVVLHHWPNVAATTPNWMW